MPDPTSCLSVEIMLGYPVGQQAGTYGVFAPAGDERGRENLERFRSGGQAQIPALLGVPAAADPFAFVFTDEGDPAFPVQDCGP